MGWTRMRKEYTDKAVRMGWMMYDWANGAYFLVITTAIFPIFYNAITTTEGTDGAVNDKVMFLGWEFINTQLYSYVLGASFLIVILASPLLAGASRFDGSIECQQVRLLGNAGYGCQYGADFLHVLV